MSARNIESTGNERPTFIGRLAVITGAGTGMGRELALQLAAEGCHLGLCDVIERTLEETRAAISAASPEVRISTHLCDVSKEDQVIAFRDEVLERHDTDRVDLLFNNAGIGGGGSFVDDERAAWERTFDICWGGVYLCSRAFLPALMRSEAAHLVNTSSVNGFWASLGPRTPHTAYSAAKFAVKGFSEALIADLRVHAPQVQVHVVMPGHIGTDIGFNSAAVHGQGAPLELSDEDTETARQRMIQQGLDVAGLSLDEVRQAVHDRATEFRDQAPVSAGQASTVILDGVRAGNWRILIGDDAHALDQLVRAQPEMVYDENFLEALQQQGHLQGAINESE